MLQKVRFSIRLVIDDLTDIVEFLTPDALIILSSGMHEKLKVICELITYLEDKGYQYEILQTQKAIDLYTKMVNSGKK
jgi:hypothetical protein